MEMHLPNAQEAGIAKAKSVAMRRSSKLTLHILKEEIPCNELDNYGFSLPIDRELPNSAHVDIYDGSTCLFHAMIIHSEIDGEFKRYEFKRVAPNFAHPPRDFANGESDILAGLIPAR